MLLSVVGANEREGELEIRQSSIQYAGLLGRRDKGLIDQVSEVPTVIFFFTISCKILFKCFQYNKDKEF